MQHACPDGVTHTWIPRVENPKVCPRCKGYLDKTAKKEQPVKEVIELGSPTS